MSYIGNTPAENYASFLTETFSVSATANYTLTHAVSNENDIRLVINSVVQQPGSGKAYTASGTTLTLTSATSSGDVMYAVYLGRALQTVTPPNASVGTSQLIDGNVTLAKLGADSVNATKIADGSIENEHLNVLAVTGHTAETSIADGDTILIHDASASALRKMTKANFVSGVGENNRPYVIAAMHPSGTATLNNASTTKVPFNQSLFNVDGTYSENDARWTPGVAGRYYIQAQIFIDYGNSQGNRMDLKIYVNGSRVVESRTRAGGDFLGASTAFVTGIVTLDDNDYVEIFAFGSMGGNQNYDKNQAFTWFNGFKIANT